MIGGENVALKKNRREFWDSARANDTQFDLYYKRLVELSISMFDWQGLPDTIDPRYMELVLFSQGNCVFFRDEDLGYLSLMCTTQGRYNVYGIPIYRRAYAINGYNKELSIDDSVIIFNNMLHTNSMTACITYARRLADLDRTIDVNVQAQKTPVLIRCSEPERLTMLNLYKEYTGNAPFIFGDKNLNPQGFTVLRTDAPYMSDKIYTLKTQIWNEALTYLGISNVNIQKKERLITDEVTRNQGGTVASRYSRLEARRQACDEINRLFGLNVSCDYREDFQPVDPDEINDTLGPTPAGSIGE